MTRNSPTLVIASFLEADLVERIRASFPQITVVYDPSLLPPPRYPADHTGGPFSRSDEAERRWRAHLVRAEIMFDFDRANAGALPELAPRLAWLQGTSAGIGQFVRRHRYVERMPHTVFTTASGVHAKPLAEFCMLTILTFVKNVPQMRDAQRRRHWERFATTDLEGRTMLIVGHGAIGSEVARVARAFGMHVIGIKRTATGDPHALHADELHGLDALPDLLPRAEFLVLSAPHTAATEAIIDDKSLARLPPGAVLVNIGRGALVDEGALVTALRDGKLAGAGLDVFQEEPLPETSPLWDMPNVIVCPHSAATSDRENRRIVDLFCDNLERFLAGKPLRNVYDARRGY